MSTLFLEHCDGHFFLPLSEILQTKEISQENTDKILMKGILTIWKMKVFKVFCGIGVNI